jgi:hypothetical protein
MQESGQYHNPAALPPGEKARHLLSRRPGGSQSQPERCGEKKHLFLRRHLNRGLSIRRTTTLSRILSWLYFFLLILKFILLIPYIFSLSYISLTNQCTLIIFYYTIQFTVKLFRNVSNPYFGIIIRDLDCELHKLQINNNGT